MSPCWQKMRKGLHLSPWAKNEKNKDTSFSSTFKFWESKVPSVFSILAQRLIYSHFLISRMSPCWSWRLYLSPEAKIEKTKGTLFSSTFKVWESKVPLVFYSFDYGQSYGHSMNLQIFPVDVAYRKMTTLKEALPMGSQSPSLYFWAQGDQENGEK